MRTGVQTSGYLKYQFFEHESLVSPFHAGTYDGVKKVLALGAGFGTQQRAMRHLNAASDTVITPLKMVAVDVFGELPLIDKQALTFYAGYYYYDFGPNYIRVIGLNNVGGGVNSKGTFSDTENAFPAIGTGHIGYVQLGYLFGFERYTEKIQRYFSGQYASYDGLQGPMTFYEAGINLLLDGQRSKLSIAFQNRPVFDRTSPNEIFPVNRRNTVILQFQIRLD